MIALPVEITGDARNADFQSGRSIPFTQYMRPTGRPIALWIDTGEDGIDADVVAKAREIVGAGFFLEMEELPSGEVSLSIGDDEGDYAHQLCPNGPEIPQAVRRLIIYTQLEDLRSARIAAGAE